MRLPLVGLLLVDCCEAVRFLPSFFSRRDKRESGARTLHIFKGDISRCNADALVSSANPMMEGTRKASHWRFAGRANADAAIRAAGGQALARAVARYAASAAPLEIASAHVTKAGGSLSTRWVIHCVAPSAVDYEESRGRELLKGTYAAALRCASDAGARSVALPAIGTGIAGFSSEAAADCAFAAVRAWLEHGGYGTSGQERPSSVRRVDLVLFADNVYDCWATRAIHELGEPDNTYYSEVPVLVTGREHATDRFGVRSWTRAAESGERAEVEEVS